MNKKISAIIKDFYKGKDLRVDHFLIRCARTTDLFSHLDEDIVDLGVYNVEQLLNVSLADYYRSRIKELNLQMKAVVDENKKASKMIYKRKMLELKENLKNSEKKSDKYKEAKVGLIKFKRMGYDGYQKFRKVSLRDKIVPLGDLVIESEEFNKKRNSEVLEFMKSLPKTIVTQEMSSDWQEIKNPKGYDKFFRINEKQFSSREQYLKTILCKLRSLNSNKREAFEKMMLECAEARAQEEQEKQNQLKARFNNLRYAIWAWPEYEKYNEVTKVALEEINKLMANQKSKETSEYARLKTNNHLHRVYQSVLCDIEKQVNELDYQM